MKRRLVVLSDAAVCLLGIDDPEMRKEMGLPSPESAKVGKRGGKPRGTVFVLDDVQAEKLASEFRLRLTGGWAHENVRTVHWTVNGALKAIARGRAVQ